MFVYFINGWENAHFLGPMRTNCGPKYQKSLQCGHKASFEDLFGNTGLNTFLTLSPRGVVSDKGGEAIGISKHFVNAHLGLD